MESVVLGRKHDYTYQPLVRLIRNHAKHTPEAPAVEGEGESISYRELCEWADGIAKKLKKTVAPGELVAIIGSRSPGLVAAALGVLQVGGVYVPIATVYPRSRVAHIVEDSAAKIILTDDAEHVRSLELTTDLQVVDVRKDVRRKSTNAKIFEAKRKDPAYIIYTSGSTGLPKGALMTHGNLANFLDNYTNDFGVSNSDRVGWLNSVGFDASISELWPALRAGATLYCAPDSVVRSFRGLLQWVHDNQISMMFLPTAIANALLARTGYWWEDSRLRVVLTGGDRLLHRPPVELPFRFINCYGPTECTVWATWSEPLPQALPSHTDAPSLGRPIANASIAIMGDDGKPKPVGEKGEIWIGGLGVSNGYVNRPELTEEKFVPDASAPEGSEARMYRTGDNGVLLPDGIIEFVGRSDFQIALNGFRIEAGEVEAAISSDRRVGQCVVMRHDDAVLGPRLVAFVETASGASLTPGDLRKRLKAELPGYMVPSQFIVSADLPRTPNGKIDRKALEVPKLDRSLAGCDYVAPRTETERAVVEAFQSILGIPELGVHDDFFVLGGDSLSAVEAEFVIEEKLGVRLPPSLIYEGATAAKLSAAISPEGVLSGSPLSAPRIVDWVSEVKLELPAAVYSAEGRDGDPKSPILLTGPAGFIGSRVLQALTADDAVGEIDCFVRGKTHEVAVERLAGELRRQRVSARGSGVVAVPTDLALPRLGQTDEEWDMFARRIGGIIHLGAQVHHLLDYAHLKAPNVDSTAALLKLAARAGGAPVCYASTVSVVLGESSGGLKYLGEADAPLVPGGYAEGKWVGERLVRAARSQGLPATSLRIPRATADTRTGAFGSHDSLMLLLAGSIRLGAYPDWSGWELVTPVDVLAKALIAAYRNPDAPEVYAPMDVLTYSELFERAVAAGFSMERADDATWRRLLTEQRDNPAYPLFAGAATVAQAPRIAPEPVLEKLQPIVSGMPDFSLDDAYFGRMFEVLRESPLL